MKHTISNTVKWIAPCLKRKTKILLYLFCAFRIWWNFNCCAQNLRNLRRFVSLDPFVSLLPKSITRGNGYALENARIKGVRSKSLTHLTSLPPCAKAPKAAVKICKYLKRIAEWGSSWILARASSSRFGNTLSRPMMLLLLDRVDSDRGLWLPLMVILFSFSIWKFDHRYTVTDQNGKLLWVYASILRTINMHSLLKENSVECSVFCTVVIHKVQLIRIKRWKHFTL